MAWNGSGTFARLYNWVSRAANPATKYIDPTSMDAEFDNYKTGLENCLTKTGETTPTANQPMGNYRHTGVGAASTLTDYARAGEVQKGTIFKAASPGGTIDAMTGTLTPTPTLTAGQLVSIIAPGTGDNTVTNPTIALNGGSAVTIKKHQGALVAGDYTAGDSLLLLYDGTYFELLNPKYSSAEALMNRFTTDSTGGATTDFIPFIDESETPDGDNKVLVTDLFKNILANFTAKTAPVAADTVMIADSAASGAAKISTLQQIWNMITGLTAKTTPVVADSIPVADSAASGAAKYSTLQQIFNAFTGLTALTIPDFAADKIPIFDNSAGSTKYALPGRLVSGGVLSKNATYLVTAADAGAVVKFTGHSANVELQLPAAATCGDGFEITFVNTDSTYAYKVTVNPNGSETIDSQATRASHYNSGITLICDGTNWHTKCGTWVFATANLTLTTGSEQQEAHGQPGTPRRFFGFLVCTTIDNGYAVGDVISQFIQDSDTAATNFGSTVGADATNLFFIIGSNASGVGRIQKRSATIGSSVSPTLSSWKAVVVGEW